MTRNQKIIAMIAVAIVFIGAMLLYIESANAPVQEINNENQTGNNSSQDATDESNQNGLQQNTADEAGNDGTPVTSPTDTSDTAIDKDLASVDAQINNLSTDSANIDTGLNDQPIEQGE